jgi:hypothetical protein
MKSFLFTAGLATLLLPAISTLHATETLRLETRIFILKNADFHQVNIPGAGPTDETHGTVFQPPVVAHFDQATLSLDGIQPTWNGSKTPPESFDLIAAPTIILTTGQPVSISSTAPAQYFERLGDDNFQVREIPANSPEAPHCRLKFMITPAVDAAESLLLACNLDIVTVATRTKIPGVALEIGKPLLATFKEDLKFTTRKAQWSALFLQAPNGSDFSLLVLLKVAPVQTPPVPLSKVGEYHLKTGRFGAVAVAQGDYVYVIGGHNTGGILSDIERFDVRSHEVTRLTNKLTPRYNHGAALIGGKIYVFGGHGYNLPGGSPFEATMDIYDLESGKISHGAPLPTPRGYFATASLDQKIYVIGGAYGEPATMRQTNWTEIYDPATDTWSKGVPMPTIRECVAVTANGCIVVAGGYRKPTNGGLKTVECFVSDKNQWLSLPDLGRPVSANSAAVLGNYLFLFGNYDPADEILAYDLTTHTSTVFKDGFTETSQSTAVALNGLIYVIGGTGGGAKQRTARDAMDNIQVFSLTATPEQ